jgi:DNA (cytosine-5)-methyltransferase 1
VDLFCGAGGLSLGLRDAGFTILVGADSDPACVETHTANLGGLGYVGDLSEPHELLDHLEGWGISSVDLVAGGPPCQPFSRAGRDKIRSLVQEGVRSIQDPRAQLWRGFVSVVERLQPRAVLVENVPDLPAWNEGAVLISLHESLRELNYHVDARILDAFNHGVPQHRARLFLVGVRGRRTMSWPRPRRARPTLRMAIGDLPPVPPAQRQETLSYRGPQTALQRRLRRGMRRSESRLIHDHITRDVRPDDHEAFRLLGEGQTYADLPERLQRYRSDIFTDKYKRLSWDELSRSITAHIAKDGYWYIHPAQHRTLSVREAARIQTFPDGFRFAGQPTIRLKQIGNAVPPFLAEELGRQLIRTLDGSTNGSPRRRSQADRFRRRLTEWHAAHSRSYPWREGLDPWRVLMAEMCLHRTRADQVVPVFEALCRLAPTPGKMVEREGEALAAMRSLGLRWRAENIIAVARALVEDFDGRVPDTELELRALPGVGDYVAQAVLCFGFARRAVLLDTNTSRIVGRYGRHQDTRRWQLRLDLYGLAGSRGPDAEFNYALLDLGALICRAGAPRCEICPLSDDCATFGDRPPAPQLELIAE